MNFRKRTPQPSRSRSRSRGRKVIEGLDKRSKLRMDMPSNTGRVNSAIFFSLSLVTLDVVHVSGSVGVALRNSYRNSELTNHSCFDYTGDRDKQGDSRRIRSDSRKDSRRQRRDSRRSRSSRSRSRRGSGSPGLATVTQSYSE